MHGWLVAAYAIRALLPLAPTGVPDAAFLANFHASSAVWYACRWRQIRLAGRKGVYWSEATKDIIVPARLTRAQLGAIVLSAVMQCPLYNPAAAAAPFLLSCLMGIPATSNVMLLSQAFALCTALLFEGTLLLPIVSTLVALAGYGELGSRGTPRTFAWAAVAHCITAAGALGLRALSSPTLYANGFAARMFTATFLAILCAEARVRAATELCSPPQHVMWVCRAATLGSMSTLTFRVLCARSGQPVSHVATGALTVLVLLSPWQWQLHGDWRRRGESSLLRPTPTAVSLIAAAAITSLCPV